MDVVVVMNLHLQACLAVYSSLTEAPTALGIHRCQMKRAAGDTGLQAFWVPSSVLLLESERRPGESRAEGTAFTLLQEGDTRVSGAPEHSGAAAPAPPPPAVGHMCAARGGAAAATALRLLGKIVLA